MANPSNPKKHSTGPSMSSSMKALRIRTLVLVMIEIVALIVATLFYIYDIPTGFQAAMKPEYWVVFVAGVLFINILLLWFSEMHLSAIRQRSDLDAAAIIGSDVQEAYNFGQIGLVVTDDADVVMWTNTLFKERQIDLLDKNIINWQPTLSELKNAPSDMVVKIEVNGRNYNVRYLSDAHLFIFKDTSAYESIFQYSQEQAIVVGLIMIDNYADIGGKTEEDNNDLITKIRGVIFDYAKEYGALLRRYRSDSYFVICNYASLARMEKDEFSVLGKIRALGKGENVTPTLSIGLAHDFPDVVRLDEMAGTAIDIAMSRGGDQAVVSRYGEDMRFYGGKTTALENTSRVQFRSIADSLLGIINSASNVIVSGHMDMDMDALGACLGIMAMCEFAKRPCQIVYDPKLTEKKTRFAFQSAFSKAELDRMTLTPKEAEDRIRPTTLFVVVDVSVPHLVMGNKALEKSAKTIVIDHHRRGEAFIDKPVLSYVDPSAASASEIIAELIHYATANPRIELSPTYATLMLSGIFLDTSFFKSRATGIRSFEAAEILKEFGADNQKADDYLKDEYEEYALITKIISTIRTPYTGICYCVADEKDIIERATLSKVANQLMQLKGVNAAFVLGRTQANESRLSARSNGSINVQILCEKMGGGGHFGSAAAVFPNTAVSAAETILLDTLDTYLEGARSEGGNNQ